jgi:membrane-associated phospholipid phosphatase
MLTAAVGGTVAAERVLAGRHFYSDVAVSALAGFAVGTLVPVPARARERRGRPRLGELLQKILETIVGSGDKPMGGCRTLTHIAGSR